MSDRSYEQVRRNCVGLCDRCYVQSSMSKKWTTADIPLQTGRRALITGANSGIGYATALALARRGAAVALACRNRERGEAAVAKLISEAPGAQITLELLDLSSLASVRALAERELERNLPLDLLINNAGVMAPPRRLQSTEGFELQFGTNVLGHFALTALLYPALERAAARAMSKETRPRVVTVSSIAHKRGKLKFNDLQALQKYSPMESYQQSKLANLMFAFELERRFVAHSSGIVSLAAHPGVAQTNLFITGSYSAPELLVRKAVGHLIGAMLNSEAEGALPTLYAAIAPDATPGGYYGPQGFQETRGGDVGPAHIAPQALDIAAAGKLWGVCEELTGISFL
jgi:NAD(P)-dependent dehydrogenase (short-subunit alcohol dehydrogenase family)